MNERIEKSLLGITGEYYVAAELARRNIYAQLTLGNQKRTDLLIFSHDTDKLLKVEVKCKQTDVWPNCKGINSPNSVIVFVDFKKKLITDRPSFYILDNNDWSNIVKQIEQEYNSKHPGRKTKIEGNVLILLDEVGSSGKPYEGCSIKISDIENFENCWEKIVEKLN